jgi:hypothetical protein
MLPPHHLLFLFLVAPFFHLFVNIFSTVFAFFSKNLTKAFSVSPGQYVALGLT